MEIVPIMSLWLPILVSAVVVFIASAIFWTVLPHHKTDYAKLPNEDAVLAGMRSVSPGHYMFPFTTDMAEFKTEAFQKRLDAGPVGMMSVTTADARRNMGPSLIQSFAFYLVVSILVAYLTGRTLDAGASYLDVFRVAGTVAVVAHTTALIPFTIWFTKHWRATWKWTVDGIVLGVLTAGVFGWLWPA